MKWYMTMREGEYEYIHEFKERIDEILWLQRKHHEIIDSPTEATSVKQTSMAELHRLNITLSNYFDVAPDIIGHTISASSEAKVQQGTVTTSSFSLQILEDKPFWIWNKEEHLRLAVETNEQCCFNHIVGLLQKDGKEYPLFDYEKLLYDALMSTDGSFKDKHLWVKKATGLGVTEFMLRIMAWICTSDIGFDNGQMCIVTGPNIDIATKLIRRLKNMFERN